MAIKVRSNRLGEIAALLPRHINLAVSDTADRLEADLKRTVWLDTGLAKKTSEVVDKDGAHATVGVGRRGRGRRGWAFYSRFNEWGTVKQIARPRVGPAALKAEAYFVRIMTREIRKACR